MKRVLITGGTSGLGKNLALSLAKRNFEVHFIGRNKEKAIAILEELKKYNPKGEHKFFQVNLASLRENKEFLLEYKENYNKLNLLILNANIRPNGESKLTEEGYNEIFFTGYISRYLFIVELESLFHNMITDRIIHIGDGRLIQKLNEDDIVKKDKSAMKSLLAAYTASSYLNYFLNYKKLISVQSIFVNPGIINTNEDGKLSLWLKFIAKNPEKQGEKIINNILENLNNEVAMNFYNVDKVSDLKRKIGKKAKEFDEIYKLTKKYI